MKLVLDATPLIYLVRTGYYRFFPYLDVELFTTNEVLKELKLEDPGYVENEIIKKLLDEGVIQAMDSGRKIRPIKGVHNGELSVISLAMEKEAIAVMDDKPARFYSKSLGLDTVYSTFFIFMGIKKRLISKKNARDYVDMMIEEGWRCDVESYKNLIKVIEELQV